MTSETPIEIALRFVECINRQDHAALVELLSDDHVFIDLAGDVHRGKEVMREGWAGYFAACPTYLIHVCDVFDAPDGVIVAGRTTGSHLAQPRHVEIRDTLLWVARIREGKISGWELYEDNPHNRERLGATPTHRLTR
ncbi:MAG: nuclear transport factor 2 family protein [Anaerolineae bacterium]|jgi:ketosteroid isomerase-like protein